MIVAVMYDANGEFIDRFLTENKETAPIDGEAIEGDTFQFESANTCIICEREIAKGTVCDACWHAWHFQNI